MLIGIISDSHENMIMIEKAVELFNSKNVQLVLHAGDIISPITYSRFNKLKSKFIAVFGNNDGEKKMLKEKFKNIGDIYENNYSCEIQGHNIIMMHEPYNLEKLIDSQKYDVIIYGHTHIPEIRKSGKTLVLNPGECGGWLTGNSTVALLYLDNKEAEIIKL